MLPIALDHQNQFEKIPSLRDMPATNSGVSDEYVVATIDVPAMNHGSVRPARKKSVVLRAARRVKYTPMPNAATM